MLFLCAESADFSNLILKNVPGIPSVFQKV